MDPDIHCNTTTSILFIVVLFAHYCHKSPFLSSVLSNMLIDCWFVSVVVAIVLCISFSLSESDDRWHKGTIPVSIHWWITINNATCLYFLFVASLPYHTNTNQTYVQPCSLGLLCLFSILWSNFLKIDLDQSSSSNIGILKPVLG